MGLWQDVELRTSGPIAIRHPHVVTDLDVPSLATARLTVIADVVNATDQAIDAKLTGRIEDIEFAQDIKLAANETRTVEFSPDRFPQLVVKKPRVWWPWQLGKPEMYELKLDVAVKNELSDKPSTNFGIRHVTSRLEGKSPDNKHANRLFTINGVDLLILGGGYCPDLLQRRAMKNRPSWQEDHIRYVRDMNLNTVRLEGKLEDDAFYDLCDRYGVLVMAGWCCCSPWEEWKKWKEEQTTVALESLRYQIRRARNHPSMLAWLNGSDNPPPANIEKQYLAIEDGLSWPAPIVSSATDKKSSAEPSGVKMNGPYKWVPPNFWLTDTKTGGAWGFNTEVGPGAVPPPLESLEAMLPPEHRWPIDKVWDFHCGIKEFGNMNDFIKALDARFGKSQNIADFAWKSQAQAYETIRAMYEGFRANKFKASGEIQWMLNNAWPSMIWHLYDYYFRPGGAYFATKLACEPLHILYRYDNQEVVIANDSLDSYQDLTAAADIYDIDGTKRYSREAKIAIPANSTAFALKFPPLEGLSTTYFLRLTLTDSSKKQLSVNSYWLSKKPDVLDFSKSDWNVTPCTSFADYTDLEKLPKPRLTVTTPPVPIEIVGAEGISKATVTNGLGAVALLVRLRLTKAGTKQEVLPIRWSDNYFMLLPGEFREVTARYMYLDLLWSAPTIVADCFNDSRG
jgi:exo-1,4-beta-D-glucosaminidase